MRRLGEELDTWPMSVYRYFRDKDALLDVLAADAVSVPPTPRPGASWREQMRDLLQEVRSAIGTETGGRLPRVFLTPGVLTLPEAGLAILGQAGFPKADAARAWRALWSYTFGFATFVLAPNEDEVRRAGRSAVAALPEEEYPALADTADEFAAALASDDEFEHGLELLLDGLDASLTGSGRQSSLRGVRS